MRFRGEALYCRVTPVRNARLPSDSEHKQRRFAVLGLHSSLQSIRAAHNGFTLLNTPRFHPACRKYDILPLVTSVTGGPGLLTARRQNSGKAKEKIILHSAFCILHFVGGSGVVLPTAYARNAFSTWRSSLCAAFRFRLRQSTLTNEL